MPLRASLRYSRYPESQSKQSVFVCWCIGLSGDVTGPDCSCSIPEGVVAPPTPEPPPLLCWRMKKDSRDGVLGLGGVGVSVLGL